MEEVDY